MILINYINNSFCAINVIKCQHQVQFFFRNLHVNQDVHTHSAVNQRVTPFLGRKSVSRTGGSAGAEVFFSARTAWRTQKRLKKKRPALSPSCDIKNRTLCAGSYCSWSISPSAKNFAHKKTPSKAAPFLFCPPPGARWSFFFVLACISDILARRAPTPQGATHAHKHSLKRTQRKESAENVMQ